MTASNIVRFETEDGRTVSTAVGSPLHREYLARLEAEAAEVDPGVSSSDEGNSGETGVGTDESGETVPPVASEGQSEPSEPVAVEATSPGRGRKVSKAAAEKLDADDPVS